MKKLFKTMLLFVFIGAVAVVIASYVSKKKLESMSDDEIREFLAQKLDGKVGPEQLETIQNSVIAGVRKTRAAVESAKDVAGDAAATVQRATSDAIDTAKDVAGDAKAAVKSSVGDAKKAAKDTAEDIADVIDEASAEDAG